MAAEHLIATWATTLRHLASARFHLPHTMGSAEASAANARFNAYVDENELELALDEAETLGSLCQAPPAFWKELQLAAANMRLADSEARYAALC
ncbi:hypothetical protein ACO0LO_18825 [Undibacterium sp. TJN25]|uniref:hypothetical protein n=1 Tax=Undibacterium sp. TJN25 TaxID=3413056 RepID=UPI003BF1A8FF